MGSVGIVNTAMKGTYKKEVAKRRIVKNVTFDSAARKKENL
jgi:hypothetical protein